MQKLISVLFVVCLTMGCLSKAKSYSDTFGRIENASEISLEASALNHDGTFNNKVKPITDSQQISRFLDEINNAKENGPGKAGYQYYLKIVTKDSTVRIMTTGLIFSYYGDGMMYEFKNKNILKEYWNININ